MIKTSLIALMTVVAVSGVAAPAFAATSLTEDSDSTNAYFSENDVIARLQQRGIEATSVESWGTLLRVNVRNNDGSEADLFFDRDSLAPVTL